MSVRDQLSSSAPSNLATPMGRLDIADVDASRTQEAAATSWARRCTQPPNSGMCDFFVSLPEAVEVTSLAGESPRQRRDSYHRMPAGGSRRSRQARRWASTAALPPARFGRGSRSSISVIRSPALGVN